MSASELRADVDEAWAANDALRAELGIRSIRDLVEARP